MVRTRSVISLSLALLTGSLIGSVATTRALATPANQAAPPAYLIVASQPAPDPAALAPYAEAAGPLAAAAGLEAIAWSADVLVLEGEWPYEGRTLLLETFPSMRALEEFWYSDEYQEAKQLRAGLMDIDFIVAVEGIAP